MVQLENRDMLTESEYTKTNREKDTIQMNGLAKSIYSVGMVGQS